MIKVQNFFTPNLNCWIGQYRSTAWGIEQLLRARHYREIIIVNFLARKNSYRRLILASIGDIYAG